MVERIIQFIQKATGKDKGNDKLKVVLIPGGGHDSDCVAKEIFDKPNSLQDFVLDTPYHMLGGNLSHHAAAAVPEGIMKREGFFCSHCQTKGRFCKLDQETIDEARRNGV